MKRKIKFRGKCTGVWRKGDHLTYANGEVIKQWSGSLSPEYTVEPETVGQFTEMYDNNGNEIYEGDILKSIPFPEVVGEVIKSHGCCVIKYSEEETTDDYNLLYDVLRDYGYCVIGNVYDNPELIERSETDESE